MARNKTPWTIIIKIVTFDENHQRVITPLEDIPTDEWAARSQKKLREAMATIGYVSSEPSEPVNAAPDWEQCAP